MGSEKKLESPHANPACGVPDRDGERAELFLEKVHDLALDGIEVDLLA